jgi:uncharacterized protein
MTILRTIALFALLALFGAPIGLRPAAAQNAATPEAVQAAQELVAVVSKDTVRQLVTQVTGQVWPMVERGVRAKNPNVPDAVLADLRKEFERIQNDYMSGLMTDAPAVYARHFSAAELHELLAFYRTPIGEKALRELPQITAEVMGLIMPRLQQVQQQTMAAFTKILHDRGLDI